MPDEAGFWTLIAFTVVGSGVLIVQWWTDARHWK